MNYLEIVFVHFLIFVTMQCQFLRLCNVSRKNSNELVTHAVGRSGHRLCTFIGVKSCLERETVTTLKLCRCSWTFDRDSRRRPLKYEAGEHIKMPFKLICFTPKRPGLKWYYNLNRTIKYARGKLQTADFHLWETEALHLLPIIIHSVTRRVRH